MRFWGSARYDTDMKKTTLAWILGATALVVLGVAMAYWRHSTPPVTVNTVASSTPITLPGGGVVTSGGNATVSENPTQPAPQAPNYRMPLTYPDSMTADVRAVLQQKFDLVVSGIEKDKTNFGDWINLGILRKTVGDYAGAEADWQYVAALYSHSTVPFDNLGELYLDFLKNYPKAETNFKTALAINPSDMDAYQQLFSLYTTYGYKAGTSAAADLVAAGLKANPGNQTLLGFQAELASTSAK